MKGPLGVSGGQQGSRKHSSHTPSSDPRDLVGLLLWDAAVYSAALPWVLCPEQLTCDVWARNKGNAAAIPRELMESSLLPSHFRETLLSLARASCNSCLEVEKSTTGAVAGDLQNHLAVSAMPGVEAGYQTPEVQQGSGTASRAAATNSYAALLKKESYPDLGKAIAPGQKRAGTINETNKGNCWSNPTPVDISSQGRKPAVTNAWGKQSSRGSQHAATTSTTTPSSETEPRINPRRHSAATSSLTQSKVNTNVNPTPQPSLTMEKKGPPSSLSEPALRLAKIHGHILAKGLCRSLGDELHYLVQMLVKSNQEGCPRCSSSQALELPATTDTSQLMCCRRALFQYVCKVLECAGRLIYSLGLELSEALLEWLAASQDTSGSLSRTLKKVVAQLRSNQVPNKAFDAVQGSRRVEVVGLLRSSVQGPELGRVPEHEEQRRKVNREQCRDRFFSVLREYKTGAARIREQETPTRSGPPNQGGPGEELFLLLKLRGMELLQDLMACNYSYFAELFTACVLQAAMTGEMLVEEELMQLAQNNPSKFQKLHQRIQADSSPTARPPMRRPSRYEHVGQDVGGSGWGQGTQPGSFSNGPRQGPVELPPRSRTPGFGGPRGRGAGGPQRPGARMSGTDEAFRVADDFPPVQRVFVLFLEACDSHRLNTYLRQCMSTRSQMLMAMATRAVGDVTHAGNMGEQVLALSTLALYLSHITFPVPVSSFTSGPPSRGADPSMAAAAAFMQPIVYVNVLDVLRSSLLGSGSLILVIPWVVSYLWFLARDPQLASKEPYSSAVEWICQLYRSPSLQPHHPNFTSVHLCLRTLLEEFFIHLEVNVNLNPTQPDTASLTALDGQQMEEQLSKLAGTPADNRFLDYSCPVLHDCSTLLRHGVKILADPCLDQRLSPIGMKAKTGVRRRKAIPMLPFVGPQGTASVDMPHCVAQALAPAHDDVKLRLQQAFLAQYSADEQIIKMRDVVSSVSDVVAINGLALAMQQAVPLVLQKHAKDIGAALNGDELQTEEHMEAYVRHHLQKAIEECLMVAMTTAGQIVTRNGPLAVSALLPGDLTPPVIRTAGGIAVETATMACAQRLLLQIPSLVAQKLQPKKEDLKKILHLKAGRRVSSPEEAQVQTGAPTAGPHILGESDQPLGSKTTNCEARDGPQSLEVGPKTEVVHLAEGEKLMEGTTAAPLREEVAPGADKTTSRSSRMVSWSSGETSSFPGPLPQSRLSSDPGELVIRRPRVRKIAPTLIAGTSPPSKSMQFISTPPHPDQMRDMEPPVFTPNRKSPSPSQEANPVQDAEVLVLENLLASTTMSTPPRTSGASSGANCITPSPQQEDISFKTPPHSQPVAPLSTQPTNLVDDLFSPPNIPPQPSHIPLLPVNCAAPGSRALRAAGASGSQSSAEGQGEETDTPSDRVPGLKKTAEFVGEIIRDHQSWPSAAAGLAQVSHHCLKMPPVLWPEVALAVAQSLMGNTGDPVSGVGRALLQLLEVATANSPTQESVAREEGPPSGGQQICAAVSSEEVQGDPRDLVEVICLLSSAYVLQVVERYRCGAWTGAVHVPLPSEVLDLTSVLIKISRGCRSYPLLRQVRIWMQRATLGRVQQPRNPASHGG